ncbi:MAG: M56 family metallopeptidase [Dokdonella sp.]
MSDEIIFVLVRLVLASSLAMLVVLGLRHSMRRGFGAAISYALWLLVPFSILAVFVQRPESLPMVVAARGQPMFDAFVGAGALTSTRLGLSQWLLLAWAVGALLSFALVLLTQRRLLLRLGPLSTRADGTWQSSDDAFGPMLIGVLQPRIIVPASFDQNYDAQERELIIAHERVHRRRGDAQINAFVVFLRCLQWFNPLAHLAARMFRKDQELACDAAVIRQFPNARRPYADAMLKTQLVDSGLPVGCFWQSSHPIKERIAMFKKPLPSRMKRAIGSSVLGAIVLATSCLVWAAQASKVNVTYGKTNPPSFPDNLGDAFIEGAVYLKVQVAADGAPIQVELDHTTPASLTRAQIELLSESAIASVKSWTFNPSRRDGVAMSSWIIVPITYSKDPDSNSTQIEDTSDNLIQHHEI